MADIIFNSPTVTPSYKNKQFYLPACITLLCCPQVSPAVLEAEAVSVASSLGPSLQHIVMVAKQEADQLVDSWEAAKALKMKT